MSEIEQKMNEQTERDIPRILEVGEAIRKAKALEAEEAIKRATSPLAEQVDIDQQTKIVVYQEKIETIQKALTALRDQINMYEGLVSATAQWRDETKANKSPLNERAMIACKLFSDKLEKLSAQREGLFAKLDGYNEFIRKLENNEQLEFNL